MKRSTFKDFLSEDKTHPANRTVGIQYVEQLDTDLFVYAMENLRNFRITEKMDGVNLTFGLDEDGRFFTSRESKNDSRRAYLAEEWGESGASNVFKAAHTALSMNEELIQTALKPGESIVIEILMGDQPNAIIYGKDGLSYVVFLKPFGNTPEDAVGRVTKALDGVKTTTNLLMVTTPDGVDLETKYVTHSWKFLPVKPIDPKLVEDLDFKDELAKLKKFMSLKNAVAMSKGMVLTNQQIINMPMTIVGGDNRDALKGEKRQLEFIVENQFRKPITDQVMKRFVDTVKPELQRENPEVPLNVEGIVFFDRESGLEFKIVDRATFAATNRFFFKVREIVKTTIKTDNPESHITDRGGIFGNGKMRVIQQLQVDGLDQPRNVGRILKKFLGTDPEHTLSNIATSLAGLDFNTVKRKSIAILNNTEDQLKKALTIFNEDWPNYTLTLANGKKVRYTDEVVNRTYMSFAESLAGVRKFRVELRKAKEMTDFIRIFFMTKIVEIHNKGTEDAESETTTDAE